MTLEQQLEEAYAATLKANEPGIGDTAIRLSSLLLSQSPPVNEDQGDEGSEDVEQMPVPYILLSAKRGEESIPNSGVFHCDFTIEAVDNAQAASEDTGRLDSLFGYAIRPLFYKMITYPGATPTVKTFFQVLSDIVANFQCYGMPERATGTELEMEGSIVRRRISATFICGNAAP